MAQAHTLLYGRLDEMADTRGLSKPRFEISLLRLHHQKRDSRGHLRTATCLLIQFVIRSKYPAANTGQ